MPHHPVLPQRHSRTACTSALIGWLLVLLFAVGAAHAQTATTVEYIHTDALGSPVAVTNGRSEQSSLMLGFARQGA